MLLFLTTPKHLNIPLRFLTYALWVFHSNITAATIARVDLNVALKTATKALENNFELPDLTREIQLLEILLFDKDTYESWKWRSDIK
jgi:hypothetical protein